MENITVKILSKEYQVACPENFKTELQTAVSYLENKMLEIRDQGRVSSFEATLITAAINLAYEVIKNHTSQENADSNLISQLTLMQNKLAAALIDKGAGNKLNVENNNSDECSSNKLNLEYNNTEA